MMKIQIAFFILLSLIASLKAEVITGPTTVTLLSETTVADNGIPVQYIVTLKLYNPTGERTWTPYAAYLTASDYPSLAAAIEAYGASETLVFENWIRSLPTLVRSFTQVDPKTIPVDPNKIKT